MTNDDKFLAYLLEKNLQENSLYTTDAERDAIAADKSKVAEAFVYNFLGMLGLLNAAGPAHKQLLINHFKKDGKVRINTIGDTNNDMSLVVKMAHDAGFFIKIDTVNQITRFLAKLKMGQIDSIDSKIVFAWLDDMKPEFIRSIKDPQTRGYVKDFIQGQGLTVDVSRLAVKLKRRANKVEMGGEFKAISKTFPKIREIDLTAVTPPTPTDTQNQKTDADGTPAIATVPSTNSVIQSKSDAITTAAAAQSVPSSDTGRTTTATATPTKIESPEEKRKKLLDSIGEPVYLSVYTLLEILLDSNVANVKHDYLTRLDTSNDAIHVYFSAKIDEYRQKMAKIKNLEVPDVTKAFDELYDEMVKDKFFNISSISGVDRLKIALSYEVPYWRILFEQDEKANINLEVHGDKLKEAIYNSNYPRKQIMIDKFIKNLPVKFFLEYVYYDYNSKHLAMALLAYKVYKENLTMNQLVEEDSYFGYVARDGFNKLLDVDNFEWPTALGRPFGIDVITPFKQKIWDFLDPTSDNKVSNKSFGRLAQGGNRVVLKLLYSTRFGSDIDTIDLDAIKEYSNNTGTVIDVLNKIGIDPKELLDKYPKNNVVIMAAAYKGGLSILDKDQTKILIDETLLHQYNTRKFWNKDEHLKSLTDEVINNPTYYYDVGATVRKFMREFSKTGDEKIVGDICVSLMERNPASFDTNNAFREISKYFGKFEKESVIDIVRLAKKNNFTKFFDGQVYKDTRKRDEKTEFKDLISAVMYDCIGTDVEDYFSDVLETMPGAIIGHIRQNLVGMNAIATEIQNSQIVPFASLGENRLREILSMNDVNLAQIASGSIPRKKKNQKWVDYFKTAKVNTNDNKKWLTEPKVTPITHTAPEVLKLTKYLNGFRAGRHGNIYLKVIKEFDAHVKFPEFDEFRKNAPGGDKTVVPAFHGTGGIAASMILRYGFKVIKSSDALVVARMLGDGIYFSNKIDKACLYLGNEGYARYTGIQGYVFSLDVNLGQRGHNRLTGDYLDAGLGGDKILSPEWCVRDPKKQLAIKKVYEVVTISDYEYNNLVRGIKENTDTMSFKQHMLTEGTIKDNNMSTFRFRDGMIPIIDERDNVTYIDFEDVIKNKILPAEMIQYSGQGPVVVFENTPKQESYDFRYAETMNSTQFRAYAKYFKKAVF